MAIRLNHAKNFKGKAYVAADELDNLIKTLTFSGIEGNHFGSNGDNDWLVNFTAADGGATTTTLDLTKIKDYIDGKSITVTAGNGITVDASGNNALSPVIAVDIDSSIALVGSTDGEKKIGTNLYIKKVDTTTGYAASYQLQVGEGDGATALGAKIDIVKDQFLKSGSVVYSTDASTMTGESETKTTTAQYPFLKLVMWTNTNGDASDQETTSTIYIPVNDLFDSYTAGNKAIDSAALTSNVITVVVDDTNVVYTGANASASILSIGNNGIEVANVQGAINYAVDNEHEKASAAISAVDAKVNSLASATSAAVDDLNARVSAVADNAQGAVQIVGSAVDALDVKVQTAIVSVNSNVESAVDAVVTNVNTAISANISSVNSAVNATVTTVNTKVDEAVSSVNENVSAFKSSVNDKFTEVDTAIGAFESSVNDAITARSTQLASAVEIIDSSVTPQAGTGALSATYSTTVAAKYIIGVYAADGGQIYPEIVRNQSNNAFIDEYTITADYGEAQDTVEEWHVLCAKALPTYNATVTYTPGNGTVAYTDAGNGTDASYNDVTKTDVVAVDAPDVTYTANTDVDGTTVGNGNPATAPTPVAAVSEADLDYNGHSANA